MKSTFLLSIFLLTACLGHAQNPPCNITKLDWQTAFTSDEGTVSYFMESSDCKGKELCGHPRIGLKHSFKKPIWVKVKLKGFNCDNQTVGGEFYSNRTYIAPNEVYVAAHNWHTFKTISEVVNVEIAFEETKVQSMIFNKEDNTLDTYVDGKLLKKEPSEAEIKAAAQESAEKAKKLAAAEQAKKQTNNAAAPSVKNAIVEKTPTTKAPVGKKTTQKQGKNAATKATAPPSVNSELADNSPTTKAPIGQKNSQKQGKKATTKVPNTPVKNTNVHPKTTTAAVDGQQKLDKSNEKTVAKNSTASVENSSKTSVPPTTTTATQEALKKATEPTVAEESAPSAKTEKRIPDQTSVQPVAQPNVQANVGKTPEVAVVKETAPPSVKSKNAVPFNEITPPEAQGANQAKTQAGAKPSVDKKDGRPQAYMPAKQPQKVGDAKKTAAAPIIEPEEKGPLNVLKTNLLYPISLGFEHGLGKHFSVFVNGFFMPVVGFNNLTKTVKSVRLLKPSVGFAAEARYYISKTQAPMNGIYWGGFYTSRSADLALRTVSETSSSSTDATIKIPLGLQMYGLMIGKQKIRERGFTTDIGIGVGSYTFFGIPNISPNAEGIFGRIGELTKRKTGVAPRLNVNLGYAF